jgi:membrane fusion protein, multidrug efflux system
MSRFIENTVIRKENMRTTTLMMCFAFVGAGLSLAGCSDSVAEKPLKDMAVVIEVAPVKVVDRYEGISYSGTIEESESTALSFAVPGRVSRVLVREGDVVYKGQLLAELDDRGFRNAYEIAQATLTQAEDAHRRLSPMHNNGNLPEIKYVEIQTGLQKAKSATAIAKKSLDDCRLYSPVNGVVGRRAMDPGMNALPNLVSIDIVQIEKVYAKVAISENDIASIGLEQPAAVTIGALDQRKFEGGVENIGVMADPISHTYKIKIGIDNSDRQIKPGMICHVALEKSAQGTRLSVPSRAMLIDEQGRKYVYVVKDHKAVKRYVETGELLKNGVEIEDGLRAGEQIVVAGQQKLVDHSMVRIANPQEQ